MQVRVFTVSIHDGDPPAEELNQFLGRRRILARDRHFVQDGPNSAWAVRISSVQAASRPQPYPLKRGKIDYREVPCKAVLRRLRSFHRIIAQPIYVPRYMNLRISQSKVLLSRFFEQIFRHPLGEVRNMALSTPKYLPVKNIWLCFTR